MCKSITAHKELACTSCIVSAYASADQAVIDIPGIAFGALLLDGVQVSHLLEHHHNLKVALGLTCAIDANKTSDTCRAMDLMHISPKPTKPLETSTK